MKRLLSLLWLLTEAAFAQEIRPGGDAFVDSEAPGAKVFSSIGTVTAINSRQHGNQLIFKLNPSAADSTGDARALYVRLISQGIYNINETVGFSSYNYHEGSGNLAIAYGSTNQFLNRGPSTVSFATGSFNQARQQDFPGQINLARGSLNAVQNWRSSGTGIVNGYGSHNKIEQSVSGGRIESGYATMSEITMAAAGTITHGYAGRFLINGSHAGGTITNGVSIRASFVNNGAVVNYSGVQIDAPIGNLPTGENLAINSMHPGPSLLYGSLRIGSSVKPKNTLDVSGSFGRGVPVVITSDYAVGTKDNWLVNDKPDSTLSVTLPSPSAYAGRELYFTNWQAQAIESDAANVIPLGGGSPANTILPDTDGAWSILVSTGTEWAVMQSAP